MPLCFVHCVTPHRDITRIPVISLCDMHVISQNKRLWPNLCVSLFSCPIAIQAQRHFKENYLHVCLLFLLQETAKSHSSFLKPFLITTRDSISSDSCLFPGVPKKKRPDSFWVSWVSVRFSLKTPECTTHLLRLILRFWGIRVPQSLCPYVLDWIKRHK